MIFHLEVNGELKRCTVDDPDDERMLLLAAGLVSTHARRDLDLAVAQEFQRGIARLIVEAGKFTAVGGQI